MKDVSLDAIFGNTSATRVLLFVQNYGEGYASQIARTYEDMSVSRALQQLDKFEAAGLLVSTTIGRSRVYTWNPRNPRVKALRYFLQELLNSLPVDKQRVYFRQRRRPRRRGKPLEK
jgi:hypothetical protein